MKLPSKSPKVNRICYNLSHGITVLARYQKIWTLPPAIQQVLIKKQLLLRMIWNVQTSILMAGKLKSLFKIGWYPFNFQFLLISCHYQYIYFLISKEINSIQYGSWVRRLPNFRATCNYPMNSISTLKIPPKTRSCMIVCNSTAKTSNFYDISCWPGNFGC